MHTRTYRPDEVLARTALAPIEVDGALPENIMWMPPGTHSIRASRGGEPADVTVTVDEALSQIIARSFAAHMAAAERGTGERVYFDLNHDDQKASAWVTGFYWAGTDPKTGGIRARVEWTRAGREAVMGRDYRQFSPAFLEKNGTVYGIPSNAGGLVNRPAFKAIAPIVAKAEESDAIFAVASDFERRAAAFLAKHGGDMADAYLAVAEQDPDAYDVYRFRLGLGGPVFAARFDATGNLIKASAPREEAKCAAAQTSLMTLAKARMESHGGDLVEAVAAACEETPALYDQYRAALGLGGPLFRAQIEAKDSAYSATPEKNADLLTLVTMYHQPGTTDAAQSAMASELRRRLSAELAKPEIDDHAFLAKVRAAIAGGADPLAALFDCGGENMDGLTSFSNHLAAR